MVYIEKADPAAFLATARELGIATIILAWQEEYGQQEDPSAVRYERLARITLLGYERGTGRILRCTLPGGAEQRAQVRADATAAGLAVEERCRNIIGFAGDG
ncbi:MAG: hypothetical protein H0X38_18695 [Planctomycetes bacterium]|nr:hypothetical protein [Planctomycetota bacterium]